jgi:ADP-ribose pyrophosphatase
MARSRKKPQAEPAKASMKVLKVEKLTDEQWVNLFAAEFEHKGHRGRWVFASRRADPHQPGDHCDAVVIVPILREAGQPPQLVMIREFRVPVGGYIYGLPAGLLEEGETVETTTRREVQEETGLEVTAIRRVTQALYLSAGLTDEAVAMAFVDVRAVPGGAPKLDKSEDSEVVLLDYPQLCALCDDRSVRIDAKAWWALYLYQQLGKLE